MEYAGQLKYPAIFTPGKIGNIEVKNRTIMSPMGCSASPGGYVNQAVINHYSERARGGVGLTIPEIQRIENKYAQAALRAKAAGFDGVEMHSTGYYLGAQFLSRSANIRTDEYGGEPENRILFHKNVYQKIRALCGEAFPVCIKATLLQGEDITFEDGAYYALRFAQIGFAGLEVMAGGSKSYPDKDDLPTTTGPENQMFDMAAAFKGIVAQQLPQSTMQFFSGGRAHEPGAMNEALAQGKCDFVFLGKAIFAEPHLVNLIREDRYDEARPCIGCWLCSTVQLDSGEPGRCSGNPVQGRGDQSFALTPLAEKKKVVVIGAGIAGVEAAVTARRRGADVVLFEREGAPGGQVRYACATPNKDYIARFIPYFARLLEVNEVDVRYHTEATAQMVLAEQPDAVICATGVLPAKLNLPGFQKPHVLQAKEVLDGKETGQRVVVVGGGVVGCETAELLLSHGKDVTIVEMLPELATRMLFGNRCVLLAHLAGYGLQQELQSTVTEIRDNRVLVSGPDGIKEIGCDTVVISVGDRPNRLLYEELEGKVDQLFCIGDSNTPDCFAESVAAGHLVAAEMI